jgi:hypothetical protein
MTKKFTDVNFLVNRDDFFDLGDFFFEQAFDAHFEGHTRAGTAGAGALKADFHDFIVFSGDQFDVAAVTLQVWPDGVDYRLDFLFKGVCSFLIAAAAFFTHIKSPHINSAIFRLAFGSLEMTYI